MIHRRSFLTGLVSALAAPAIVHAGNLMPIAGERLKVVGFGYDGVPAIWWVVKSWMDERGCLREEYEATYPGEPLYRRCEELSLSGQLSRWPVRNAAHPHLQGPLIGIRIEDLKPAQAIRPLLAEYPSQPDMAAEIRRLDNRVPLVRKT